MVRRFIVTLSLVLFASVPSTAQTVYIIDSGVIGAGAHGPDVTGGDGVDCHGHGSVMRFISDIPLASVVSVRALDCAGLGSYGGFVSAAQWVRDTAGQGDLVLFAINMISAAPNTDLEDAIRASIGNGTTWVLAAGNNGDWSWNYAPANVGEAIIVAAESGGYITSWSNYGGYVDLFARSCAVGWCGTSVSAATVAGVAFTLLQQMPWAPPGHILNTIHYGGYASWSMIDPGPGTTSWRLH
jgi:hypothetical protein